jgi:predicted dehydrogenase
MSAKTIHSVGIIMNGVTGRMGLNQHLQRSIYAIIEQGGVRLNDAEAIMPRPLLVGRNPSKLEAISARFGGLPWTTSLDEALANPEYSVYFDAQTTDRRADAVRQAIAAGKHVYCEKPVSGSVETALDLYRLANRAGVKHGVVQDKLWLPGLMKLQTLKDLGFFGRILSVRGEFGYWVFEGDTVPAQRPSWNYRKEDGGGIILDMLCHWRYVLDNLFGAVRAVSCLGATHIPQRRGEAGESYDCTADDSAYATFELEGGTVAHFNSSWCVRVRRDDLLTIQVDGTKGSAVAGLRHCWIQPYGATPRPVWNPDVESPLNYLDGWQKVPEQDVFDNAFKRQWELFLRHIVKNEPFRWSLLEGAKGVQLAEKGQESWRKRAWVDVPELTAD